MDDSHNLQRFISTQGSDIDGVLIELNQGKKVGHWMWYVFPQVRGLGRSPTAERYAIQSEEEALAYLHHPVLGARLIECTHAVNAHRNMTAEEIFGYPDFLKFRSCMTLFEQVAGNGTPFSDALQIYFGGVPDTKTLSIIESLGSGSL